MSSVELNNLKKKDGIWLLFVFHGMLSHIFQGSFYPFRKHENQSVGSVVSDVSEHNLLNIEDEPADMCEHLGIFTRYRTHCAPWANWSLV